MADLTASAGGIGSKAKQIQHVAGDWVEPLARAGYTAKGVVYSIIGVLAVQTAIGAGGQTSGSEGAIRTLADEPYGRIMLGLMAFGLLGYVVWRFAQALFDAEDNGTDGKAIVKRLFYGVSGLAYASLAFLAGRLAFGMGSSSSGGSKQAWTAELLSQPFGQWLVGSVGVIIIALAVRHFYKAYTADFMNSYNIHEMSHKKRRLAKRVGQWGLSARGVVFSLIGIFFLQAAWQSDPSEAKGLDAALETLAGQPYGPWLLGIVAAGLVAYGVYCFSKAKYRHFETG